MKINIISALWALFVIAIIWTEVFCWLNYVWATFYVHLALIGVIAFANIKKYLKGL